MSGVRLVADGGRWAAVQPGVAPEPGDTRLPGIALPGFANTHSHAFHRALRGRTHGDGGTFWTWRTGMYALAERLEPESYYRLARAVFAEMALAGVTSVGEFHYLHHRGDGHSYDDPNAMGHALLAAAAAAGLRITLLDTCYLAGGLDSDGHQPLSAVQQRFSDGTAARWASRVAQLSGTDTARIGAAVHSVRAVPADQLAAVIAAAGDRPLHAHVSEQPAENEATLAHYGCTPTELLARHGFGGPLHTAVHATHLSSADSPTTAVPGPRSASARRPSATWPTASARRASWPTPGPASRWAATSTPSSTCSRRPAAWRWTSGWPRGGAAGSPRPSCCPP